MREKLVRLVMATASPNALIAATKPKMAFELGKDLFDGEGSGEGDFSSKVKIKACMSDIIRAKNYRK